MRWAIFPAKSLYEGYGMAGKTVPQVYWDTSVWLAFITAEQHEPDCIDGIEEHIQLLLSKKIHLVSSVLTLVEVLEARIGLELVTKFRQQFQRTNCDLVDLDSKIGITAHNIRSYYRTQQDRDGLPTIETPDAIHIATAIRTGCDTVWTFDKKNNRGQSRPKRSMISLSGLVAGEYSLIIEEPNASQAYKDAKLKKLLEQSQLTMDAMTDEEVEQYIGLPEASEDTE